jgi:hypothetical protein
MVCQIVASSNSTVHILKHCYLLARGFGIDGSSYLELLVGRSNNSVVKIKIWMQASVQECASGLDDRAFQAYTQFYTNVHR